MHQQKALSDSRRYELRLVKEEKHTAHSAKGFLCYFQALGTWWMGGTLGIFVATQLAEIGECLN